MLHLPMPIERLLGRGLPSPRRCGRFPTLILDRCRVDSAHLGCFVVCLQERQCWQRRYLGCSSTSTQERLKKAIVKIIKKTESYLSMSFFFVYFILFNNNNNFTMIGLRSLNHCLAHSSEYRSGYPLGPRRGRARSCLETWYT